MVLLIHHPISPFSRKVRILLAEKRILFVLKKEEPWAPSQDFLKLNISGDLPVFVFDGNVISGNYAITEFLEEVNQENRLINGDARHKAEIRRLVEWFDVKFYKEVYRNLVMEKVHKRFGKGQAPDSAALKAGLNNLNFHMEYIDWICESRNYLAGENFSLADITATAHLSIIDYLGDVPWEGYKNAKLWYSKIKSRPSFKDILKDNIKGILPSKHYINLDF
jgi:glutathione S-transferase